MKLKAIGCLVALLLVVGKIEASEKPAPCVVYFSVLENDAVSSAVSVSRMNKPQNSWYEKHGDREKYAGICYAENASGASMDAPLYAIVWGVHSANEPYSFSYQTTPPVKGNSGAANADTGANKDYVADGWLAVWDPKANGGKGTFVSVAPLEIQNHTDLNTASTALLIAAMEQISQRENEKLAAAASERDPHKSSKGAKGGKEGNERNGWTEITITPIDNGPAVAAEAPSRPRTSSDPVQASTPATTATAPEYSPSQSQASTSTVSVGSTPVGADIYVDDDFVGNTPSTINVPPGRHVITVKKAGFQNWARVVNFSGGLVTLNADLVAGSGPSEIPASVPTTTAENTTEPPKEPSAKIPGWIGVSAKNGLAGALVTTVSAEGPAARAGIHVGDVILALDGQLIKGKDFAAEVASLKPGTRIPVDYTRGAAAHEAWITVGSQN
jgi:hypothetical protein